MFGMTSVDASALTCTSLCAGQCGLAMAPGCMPYSPRVSFLRMSGDAHSRRVTVFLVRLISAILFVAAPVADGDTEVQEYVGKC